MTADLLGEVRDRVCGVTLPVLLDALHDIDHQDAS